MDQLWLPPTPWRRCHSASDSFGYASNESSPGLTCASTQSGFEPSMMCVTDGGDGSGVSIAPACGCTSSGQLGSQSHSAVPQRLQKWR